MSLRHAVVALACTFVVACQPAAPPAGAPLRKVRIVWRANISAASWPIADEAGFFRKQGLEAEFVELGRNQDALPSLLDGQLDVITGSIMPAYFNVIGRGQRLRFVAEQGHFDPAGCTYAALVARKGVLKGGRLEAPPPGRPWRIDLRPGAMADFVLSRALAREKLPASAVEVNTVPSDAEALALHNGSIDIAFSLGNRLPQTLASGDAEQWYAAEALAPGFPYLAMLFGPNLLDRDRALGVRLMTAYLEAIRQYGLGKTEANLAILEKRLRMSRQEILDACFISIAAKPDLDTTRLDEYQRWAHGKGLLDAPVEAAQYWDGSFTEAASRALAEPGSTR